MRPITLFCLHNRRTGGPEAIHQLSDALIEQGHDARMVYYDADQISRLSGVKPRNGYSFGHRKNEIAEYDRYRINAVGDVANNPDQVIVLPETLAHIAPLFHHATVVVWWLSVDHGLHSLSAVNLNHLRRKNVRHVCQSHYASRFIRALGFKDWGELTDYTHDMSDLATPLPYADRPKLAVFNANYKVIHDLQGICSDIGEIDSEIECVPIAGLDRVDLAKMFAKARVYVDLGSFPGKDRLPREALRMGVTPILTNSGAARECPGYVIEGDWPKFIARCVQASVPFDIDPNLLGDEKATFFAQARSVFDGI